METKKVQLNLYVLEKYRNMLQIMAAKKMLEDPRRAVSGSTVGAEILCDYLEKVISENEIKSGGIVNDKG